jgi:hypothetical protein
VLKCIQDSALSRKTLDRLKVPLRVGVCPSPGHDVACVGAVALANGESHFIEAFLKPGAGELSPGLPYDLVEKHVVRESEEMLHLQVEGPAERPQFGYNGDVVDGVPLVFLL